MKIEQKDNSKNGYFVMLNEGKSIGQMTYEWKGNDMVIDHTVVNPEFRGKGLALQLVNAGIAYARQNHHKIIAACSYVRSVFEKRDDLDDVKA